MTESRYFHIFIIRIIKYSTITIFQNEHHNIKNIESLTPKIVIWNFYSLNSIRHTVDNHRATILKINIELKIRRFPSQYNFQTSRQNPLCSLSLGGNSIYIFIYRDGSTIPKTKYEKYDSRTPLRSRYRSKTVWEQRLPL